jgi:hypothetical protein
VLGVGGLRGGILILTSSASGVLLKVCAEHDSRKLCRLRYRRNDLFCSADGNVHTKIDF